MDREKIVRLVINNNWVLINFEDRFALRQFDKQHIRTSPFSLSSDDLEYIYSELEAHLAGQRHIYETKKLAQKEEKQ